MTPTNLPPSTTSSAPISLSAISFRASYTIESRVTEQVACPLPSRICLTVIMTHPPGKIFCAAPPQFVIRNYQDIPGQNYPLRRCQCQPQFGASSAPRYQVIAAG